MFWSEVVSAYRRFSADIRTKALGHKHVLPCFIQTYSNMFFIQTCFNMFYVQTCFDVHALGYKGPFTRERGSKGLCIL